MRLVGDGQGLTLTQVEQVQVESVVIDEVRSVGLLTLDATGISLDHVYIGFVRPDPQTGVGAGALVWRTANLQLTASLVEGCAGSGLIARNSDVWIRRSVIRDNDGYGVAASCPDCEEQPRMVWVEASLIERNVGVGIWLSGVEAEVRQTDILDTLAPPHDAGEPVFSRSLEAAFVPSILLEDNVIAGGQDLGIFLHHTSGDLQGNLVSDHLGRGVWIDHLGGDGESFVVLDTNRLENNVAVGIGVKGRCTVDIFGGEVIDTVVRSTVIANKAAHISDGVQVLTGARVGVDAVRFDCNDRSGILVDGAAELSVTNNQFSNGPDSAIAIQNVSWDPTDVVIGNTDLTGVDVSFHEIGDPSDYLKWDPDDPPTGPDPSSGFSGL